MSLLARFRLQSLGSRRNDDSEPGTAGEGNHTPSNCDRLSFPPISPTRSVSLEPPPPGQPRRERSNSLEQESFGEESLRRRKRHCAAKVCRDFDLPEGALDSFTELDTYGMLLTTYGKLLWLEQERSKDADSTFIHSDDFKDILQDRLRSALVSANISRYLDGINERIWSFIKENLSVFNIEPQVMEDVRLTDYIDTQIKDVLTKQRALIKSRIASSIKKKQHISETARLLVGPSRDTVNISTAQWGRFAFLRQTFILFQVVCRESNSSASEEQEESHDSENADEEARNWSSNKFWEFVDLILDQMRKDLRKEPDADIRLAQWRQLFTDALQSDLVNFPPADKDPSRAPNGKNLTQWQKAIHTHVMWL